MTATPTAARAPGYRPRRTLPLRVEARRQLQRRRTLVIAAVLALLPFVLVAAFAIGGDPEGRGNGRITLMDGATASGGNFAATALFVSAGFLLVVPVALFCGDTVASEASWSSLRYLLAAPVPRARLLLSKLTVGLLFSAAAMLLLPLVALAVGSAAYGWGPLQLPTGGALSAGEAVPRLAVVVGYIFASQLVTAALAFWLSTVTDAPLGAVGGAVGLTIMRQCPRSGHRPRRLAECARRRTGSTPGWTPSSPGWSGPGCSRARRSRWRTPWCCARWRSGGSRARTWCRDGGVTGAGVPCRPGHPVRPSVPASAR